MTPVLRDCLLYIPAADFRSAELRELHKLIEQHRETFILAWNEHFSQ